MEGNIGSGKSALLAFLGDGGLGMEVVTEPVEEWRNVGGHNVFERMYGDPERWSALFQQLVQVTILGNHQKKTEGVKVMERSLFSSQHVFAQNLRNTNKMADMEFQVAKKCFDFMAGCPDLDVRADLIIYLRSSPEVSLGRTKQRGRGEEAGVPLPYLQQLHDLHDAWLLRGEHPRPAHVVVVDADQDRESVQAEGRRIIEQVLPQVLSGATGLPPVSGAPYWALMEDNAALFANLEDDDAFFAELDS